MTPSSDEDSSTTKAVKADGGDTVVELRKLSTINQLSIAGINGVNNQLNSVGEDVSASLHLNRVDFLDIAERSDEISSSNVVGIRAQLNNAPGGHLLLVFEPTGAQYLAQLLMEDEGKEIGNERGESISNEEAQRFVALIGETMLGGFIEGWEDTLVHDIGYESPELLYGSANNLVQQAADVDENLAALVLEVQLRFAANGTDRANVDTSIYVFPDTAVFSSLLNALGE